MNNLLDQEQKLLVLLIAEGPDASPFLVDVLSSSEGIDWDRFAELVDRHRVGALAHAGFAKFDAIRPPAEIAEGLAQATQNNAHNFMNSVKVVEELTGAFKAADIDCVVLKGIGVAAKYYQVPSQREMIDLDILVAPDRHEDAEKIATQLGFERYYPKFPLTETTRRSFMELHNAFAYVRKSDGAQLDLHWRMVQNPAMLPEIDQKWPDNVMADTASGRAIPMLSPALHFVYICVHGAKSGWARLKWLVDVDRVVRGLSDKEVQQAAVLFATHGLERLGAASLCLSRDILGTPMPSEFAQLIAQNDGSKLVALELPMIFGEMPAKGHSLKDWRHFLDRFQHSALLHRGKGYRRHALLRELARPRDLKTVPLPPWALWSLPVISPILGVGRALRRLFSRKG